MLRIFLTAAILLIFCCAVDAEDGIYRFNYFVLAGVSRAKAIDAPGYGVRDMKLLPLRPKEFVYPQPYFAFTKDIKKTEAFSVLSSIDRNESKNGAVLAVKIFDYIKSSVHDRVVEEVISDNFHKNRKTGMEVLTGKSGDNLERCRAAVCLLRYFIIPARIVYYNGDYAVEYFLKPKKGSGKWVVFSFIKNGGSDGFADPVEWEPVNGRELLSEEIRKGSAYLTKESFKEIAIADNNRAQALFLSVTAGTADFDGNTRPAGKFYLLRETSYAVKLTATAKNPVKIDFMLPYNDRDMFDPAESGFKTAFFAVKSGDDKLKIRYKKPFVKKNPPQEGIVYYLPVEMWVE